MNEPGTTTATPDQFWGNPISVYTRQQAIEDGVLVDVTDWASSGPDGMLGGFRVPVAMTHALWDYVDVDAHDHASWRRVARQRGESTRGRAHDVLWMARVAAGRSPDSDRVRFDVLMTMEGRRGRLVRRRLVLDARIDGDGVTIHVMPDPQQCRCGQENQVL